VLQPPVRGVRDDALAARDRLAHNSVGAVGAYKLALSVGLGHGAIDRGVRNGGGRHLKMMIQTDN
jgi:hypothetical protein